MGGGRGVLFVLLRVSDVRERSSVRYSSCNTCVDVASLGNGFSGERGYSSHVSTGDAASFQSLLTILDIPAGRA